MRKPGRRARPCAKAPNTCSAATPVSKVARARPAGRNTVSILVPIHTETESNTGGHWRQKARRAKTQRSVTSALVRNQAFLPSLPVVVKLTRLASHKLDDDNLQSAFKNIRDGVADVYGVDDRSDLYKWEYAQSRASFAMGITGIRVKVWGVRIEIFSRGVKDE